MPKDRSGTYWIALYFGLVLVPLGVLMLGSQPPARGFWWDLSSALGFAGTALMGAMFVLTARFRRATAPFGIDIIYYFHRQIALVIAAVAAAHPVILLIDDPSVLLILQPSAKLYTLWAGAASFVLLGVIIAISLWRKPLGLHYEGWRILHAVLSVLVLTLAMVHITGVGHYIATPWKKVLWTVISLSWVAILCYVRVVKPFSLLKKPYVVAGIRKERGNAWTLSLEPEGHSGIRFMPGQFAWLTMWHSPFSMKEHPFSFSSSSENTGSLEFTIKELGDFTSRIKDAAPGQKAFIDGPHGAFSIDRKPDSKGYVLVAGGIGIAPIMSMLRTLTVRKDQRPLILFYAYKNLEGLTFAEELEALSDMLNLRTVYILKEPHEGWEGETGVISKETIERFLPLEARGWECFICGPVPMIRISEKALHSLGVPLWRIHSELFDLV